MTTPSFEDFWAAYPKHVGKGAAMKIWSRMNTNDRAKAMEVVAEFGKVWASCKEERRQFCPFPTTWLAQRRWEDDPREWARSAGVEP